MQRYYKSPVYQQLSTPFLFTFTSKYATQGCTILQYTFARCNKYSSELDISRSLIRNLR